jgi:benzoyl-CoA reductase/2-hydroxyglutaryl-CoA dehydratase subunit BcrC/BadD/HgdB
VFPIHYSRALLGAFGLLPVEVWGPPGRSTLAGDARLQAYTCSIVRASLAFVLEGGLDVADLLVVPHGCDSLQGLGSVLLDFHPPGKPVLPLYLPRGEGAARVTFLSDELAAMRSELERITGRKPGDDVLRRAAEQEEHADALLARLHAERPTLALRDRDFYRLLRARGYLPAERFGELAREALTRRASVAPSRLPLLISGVLPEPLALCDVVEQAGAMIVADDLLCTGRRLYSAGTSPVVLRRLAESLLSGPPDSTLGASIDARAAHLCGLARRTGARAALFYVVKYCEPEHIYLPALRQALEQEGLRCTSIEVDVATPLASQTETRIEALIESVLGGGAA